MIEILAQYTRIRWLGANPKGWAGGGIGQVLAFEPARPGFPGGDSKKKGGPAYLIQLDGEKKLAAWVGLLEVEALPVAA